LNVYLGQWSAALSSVAENPFVASCAWLMFDATILYHAIGAFGSRICTADNKGAYTKLKAQQATKVSNRYMQISKDFGVSICFFVAQCGLMCYYVFFMNEDPETHNHKNMSVIQWCFATIITAIAGEDEVGTPYNEEFWITLTGDTWYAPSLWMRGRKVGPRLQATVEQQNDKPTAIGCIPVTFRTEWLLRRGMSFTVNRVFRTIILGTAPVMLSVAEPMDFIKDVMAVFFMTKLDDIDDAEDLEKHLEKLINPYTELDDLTIS